MATFITKSGTHLNVLRPHTNPPSWIESEGPYTTEDESDIALLRINPAIAEVGKPIEGGAEKLEFEVTKDPEGGGVATTAPSIKKGEKKQAVNLEAK